MCKGMEEWRKEAIEIGKAEGIEQGKAELLVENVNTMYKNGFDIETISKALSLDINFVKKVILC